MLGTMVESNLKAIEKLNPSLAVIHENQKLMIILYVKQSDTEFEVIGTLNAQKTSAHIYKVTDTAGAYIGFGSLTYQSFLIELADLHKSNFLISDREFVTPYAERIYEKMCSDKNIQTKDIERNSNLYASGYPDTVEIEAPIKHPINKMFQIIPTQKAIKIHKRLKDNHNRAKADVNDLKEQASVLGEWVSENYDFLTDVMLGGYKKLNENTINNELNEDS
ncbi:hypothetical protein UA32_11775 [Photobacterium angustum]|uniref:Phage protein n=1 Tax=Photobacterium angustum TaxID=661 RepID=A0ABX5H1U6_PHOAN|nr:hypothetical protein [Photobacterium angustum]KJG37640.1 hypothetical protein UA32_11775 [Photobacterium angustum]PSX07096.1 hypothetical protein C0W27_16125 [Photobacterium angustum]